MNAIDIARAEICRIGKSLFERGLVHASAGNISVKLDDGRGVLITPTDACLGFLDPASLAHVASDGDTKSAARPSKALALHQRIYAAEPTARCVLHTHSHELVALTLAGVWRADAIVPPLTPYVVMKVGRVPLVPYHRPGDRAVADHVAAAINDATSRGAPLRAVMLDRLGPTVWHASPAEAMATLEELEATARLWRGSGMCATSLDGAQIEELRVAFGARW